jgi:hypothetical protein
VSQLNNFGISADDLFPFELSIHEKCISSNVAADQIFEVCKKILELDVSVPLTRLPQYISKQIKRKDELECDMVNRKKNMENLQNEYFKLFDRSSIAQYHLEEYKVTVRKLQSYGLMLLEDTEKILNFLDNLADCGSDVNEVVKVLGDIKNCKDFSKDLQMKVSDLRTSLKREGHELQIIAQKLSSGNRLLAQYEELEKIGIDLSDLKNIRNIVPDIASAYSLSPEVAFGRFASDILRDYDTMVGIDLRIMEIKKLLSASRQKHLALEMEYSKKWDVYDRAAELFDCGMQSYETAEKRNRKGIRNRILSN